MRRLEDRTAIITGAAQGLGEAIAIRLAAEGCRHITVADMNADKVEQVAERLRSQYGIQALATRTNITDEEEVAEMVSRTVEVAQRLDILVANAGILKSGDITEMPLKDWRAVISVNLDGYFICAQAAARVMVQQKSGAIVQVNSKSGKKGSFRNSAYSASKFGGIGLTQSIAMDLAPHGVRVNAVCPGNLLDGTLWQQSLYDQYARNQGTTVEEIRKKYESQVPLGRSCTYEDVCNVVTFLASDESGYMTGQAINVTGGQEMR